MRATRRMRHESSDLLMINGRMNGRQGGNSTVIGLEWAGEVVETGSAINEYKLGDRVMCSGAGGYAEYAKTDWGRVAPIPAGDMSFAEAATFPIALTTMHDALVSNGRLKPGESVLIQGASSGVGLMGLQIAKHLGAALVIGTTRDANKRARLKKFGADFALDPNDPDWPEQAAKAARGGVDLIVDQISAGVGIGNMQAAAVKRIQYIGVTFRTRSIDEVRKINREMRAELWPAVQSGKLGLPIDRTFPLDEAAAALNHMRANTHFGKIVLEV